jgi:hypothetical protein
MHTPFLFAVALLAFTYTVIAVVDVELYPNSKNCTGRKIVLTSTGC